MEVSLEVLLKGQAEMPPLLGSPYQHQKANDVPGGTVFQQGYKNCCIITTLEYSLIMGPGKAGEWAGSRKGGLEADAAAGWEQQAGWSLKHH